MREKWLAILIAAACGVVWAQPVVPAGGAVNAGDYTKRVSPGGYIVIFGLNLAPGFTPALSVPLPRSLHGTSIEVSDGGAVSSIPMWYVSETQVAGQLPFFIGANVSVRVRTPEGASDWDPLMIVPRAPAFYAVDQQGEGRAVVMHPSGELARRETPLKPGQWASVYVNSLGAVEPPKPAGEHWVAMRE